MEPTMKPCDEIRVSLPVSLGRGSMVLMGKTNPLDNSPGPTYIVQRIIGLPGEIIGTSEGRVFINGNPLSEPWLPPGETTQGFVPVRIPTDEYFVMGDNRANSIDSRNYGPVPTSNFIAQVTIP